MLLGSKQHTQGNSTLWTVRYGKWLADNATIDNLFVTSSSDTCTIQATTVLGPDATFMLQGGELSERLTVSLAMTDTLGNVKHDTVIFTVIAP